MAIFQRFGYFSIYTMAIFYITAGLMHFYNPLWFVSIVPPIIPYKLELVYLTGIAEIVLGFLLVFPKSRFFACIGLIFLLILVYPANIYLALTNGKAIGVSPIVAWGRLPLQFLFIGIAYWHTKIK
tara:strand:+ start:185 stop:562 length:378 start_codon:yes stop_codon:yes gene_type:complete